MFERFGLDAVGADGRTALGKNDESSVGRYTDTAVKFETAAR